MIHAKVSDSDTAGETVAAVPRIWVRLPPGPFPFHELPFVFIGYTDVAASERNCHAVTNKITSVPVKPIKNPTPKYAAALKINFMPVSFIISLSFLIIYIGL